ncbi:hypothetical protein DYB25_010150, partial [Aphanomyces astaci]
MKLNEHNYRDWKTYFQGRLMAKGILDQLSARPTNPPDLDDQKAFGILIETIEAGQYRHVEGAANVKTAYEALAIHHRPTTKIDRIQVAMEWARLSWDMRQETLPDFIHRFQTLVKRLHEVGARETESNQVVKLLALMPWDFRHIVDRLSNGSDHDQTVTNTKIALEAEWKATVRNGAIKLPRGHANEDRALYAEGGRGNNTASGGRGQGGRGRGRGRGASHKGPRSHNGTKSGTCHYCGKEGHWQSECRKKAREDGNPSGKREPKEDHSNAAVFMFSAVETGQDMQNMGEEGKCNSYLMEDSLPAIHPIPTPAIAVPSNQDDFDRVEFVHPEEYVDRAWHPSIRPRRMVTIKGVPYMANFMSRDDLAVLATKPIPDPATIKVFPGWVISRYTVMAYDMRAVRTPHIREMIINDSYLPWLGDDAYETYINDAPFAPFDDPELVRTLRMSMDVHQRHRGLASTASPTTDVTTTSTNPLITAAAASMAANQHDASGDATKSDTAIDEAYTASVGAHVAIQHRIIVDSGASTHMTGAATHLYDTRNCHRQVIVANGGVTIATTIGKLNITTPTSKVLTLTDVLLIDGMGTTLMSIPALMRANKAVKVEFHNDTCTILHSNVPVARATMNHNQRLYVLDGTFTRDHANLTVDDTATLWHHRIGHLPLDALRTCAKAGLGLPPQLRDMAHPCMDCPRAKMHRVTVAKQGTRTFLPGECWHSDTKGPLPTMSAGGCRYYTVYVDDNTGFKIVRFSAVNTVRRVVDNAVDAILPANTPDDTPPAHLAPTPAPRRLVNPTPHHSTRSTTSHFRQAPTTAPAAANTSSASASTRPSYFKPPHMRSGPNDTGRLKHPDQFRNEMNAARRQALAASPSFATPSPDPSRHLAFDSEHPLPKRIPKPNPRYASMALAEVALDADLEGYQYDYDSFMGENTVTYRVDGVEYACAAVQAALVTMALYGLNQSGHEFEKHCKKQIASLGWAQSAHDPCVFTRGQGNDLEILGTYVDDFIVAALTQEKMDKIMTTLATKIELKRQGPVHYLLGIRISKNMDEATLTMSQDAYAAKVLDRFGMTNCHP